MTTNTASEGKIKVNYWTIDPSFQTDLCTGIEFENLDEAKAWIEVFGKKWIEGIFNDRGEEITL